MQESRRGESSAQAPYLQHTECAAAHSTVNVIRKLSSKLVRDAMHVTTNESA